VNELDGVFLYNVDDLSKVVAESLKNRELSAELAEQIVASEAAGYGRWADGEQVTPVVVALRSRMRATFLAEVERSLGGRLKHLSEAEREAFSAMVEAALNKLLHRPTTLLRKMASDEGLRGEAEQYVAMLKDLFDLSAAAAAETGQETATGEAEPPVDTPREDAVVTGAAHSGGTQGVR
jgi:glutamyl-tRNA reductase